MQASPTRSTTAWVVALTGIGSLMAALDTIVVSTALNTIRTSLGASVEALEWTINAYILSYAVLMMTGAALGDRLGGGACSSRASRCSPSPRWRARWHRTSAC